jgi:hypothetical protein
MHTFPSLLLRFFGSSVLLGSRFALLRAARARRSDFGATVLGDAASGGREDAGCVNADRSRGGVRYGDRREGLAVRAAHRRGETDLQRGSALSVSFALNIDGPGVGSSANAVETCAAPSAGLRKPTTLAGEKTGRPHLHCADDAAALLDRRSKQLHVAMESSQARDVPRDEARLPAELREGCG